MADWCRRKTSPPVASSPTHAEAKVRVALVALDQAAQAAAGRSVGMDTKASILLVIAGIITTSSFSGDGLLYRAAVVLALTSGVAALVSLWPRQIKGAHPEVITNHLTANKETLAEFEYWLLALQKAAAVTREQRMKRRGLFLAIGFTLAVAAMGCGAVSLFQNGDWFAAWLGTFERAASHPATSLSPLPTD